MVFIDAHTSFNWSCGYTLGEQVHVEYSPEHNAQHFVPGVDLLCQHSPAHASSATPPSVCAGG